MCLTRVYAIYTAIPTLYCNRLDNIHSEDTIMMLLTEEDFPYLTCVEDFHNFQSDRLSIRFLTRRYIVQQLLPFLSCYTNMHPDTTIIVMANSPPWFQQIIFDLINNRGLNLPIVHNTPEFNILNNLGLFPCSNPTCSSVFYNTYLLANYGHFNRPNHRFPNTPRTTPEIDIILNSIHCYSF